jgi:hypothetical protein
MTSFFTHATAVSLARAKQCVGLLLGLSLLTATGAQAQSASSYLLTPSAGTFTPTTGGTAVPAILRDEAISGSLPIGFTFSFGGVAYTTFQASSNGLLGFGGSLSTLGGELSNTLASSQLAGASLPALAPFWTDLSGSPGTGATAQYLTTGTAPNRVLTMEWLDYKDLNGDASQYISFQVKLYETTGRLEYNYRRGPAGEAGDATIGLKATDGSFLSLSSAGIAPTVSATTSYNRLNRPATGQVYAWAPATTPLAAAPALAAAEVTVFPSPAHAACTVLVPAVAGASTVQVELRNTLGQVVRQQAAVLPATGARVWLATAGLPAGVYTLHLQAGAARLAKRIVVD